MELYKSIWIWYFCNYFLARYISWIKIFSQFCNLAKITWLLLPVCIFNPSSSWVIFSLTNLIRSVYSIKKTFFLSIRFWIVVIFYYYSFYSSGVSAYSCSSFINKNFSLFFSMNFCASWISTVIFSLSFYKLINFLYARSELSLSSIYYYSCTRFLWISNSLFILSISGNTFFSSIYYAFPNFNCVSAI